MANRHRGEIAADLGGLRRTLCLTLGALAELEDAFGTAGLAALAARFEGGALTARDLIAILGCGLRGGGEAITDAEVATLTTDGALPGFVGIAAALIAATFGSAASNPPLPQGAKSA